VIETQHSISIGSGIGDVWDYVQDIRRWANLMPGAQDCTMLDPDHSRWRLKVGAGGLVRTVTVLVHVEEWDVPTQVRFSYKLEGDPVVGAGVYRASPTSAQETQVTFAIRVAGSGPMSRLWEAMSTPLLPQLVKSFAERLKAEIEKSDRVADSQPANPEAGVGLLRTLGKRLLTRGRVLLGLHHFSEESQ